MAALNAIIFASKAYAGVYAAILQGYDLTPAYLRANVVRLVEAQGVVAGFYSLAPGPEPELDLLFTADEVQGRGLGRLLFEDMAATARAAGATEVKIVSHPPAEGFYLKQGARRAGVQAPGGRATWPRPILTLPLTPGPGPTGA